jgi:hypothetical protein
MFKVYWTDSDGKTQGMFVESLSEVLRKSEQLRKEGNSFVTMVSEDPNQVGKPGVDMVSNGICPDGTEYEWKKHFGVGKHQKYKDES